MVGLSYTPSRAVNQNGLSKSARSIFLLAQAFNNPGAMKARVGMT
jgi:hypothetical protein